jgi:hypothetical protein
MAYQLTPPHALLPGLILFSSDLSIPVAFIAGVASFLASPEVACEIFPLDEWLGC